MGREKDPAVAGMDEMCDRGPDLLTDEQRRALGGARLTELQNTLSRVAAFIRGERPAMHVNLTPPPVRLNGDRTVAVATEVYWIEDMSTAPRGVKLQLLGAGGVAAYGQWDGKNPFWKAWAPVPARRPR